jgi:hypothetical protein
MLSLSPSVKRDLHITCSVVWNDYERSKNNICFMTTHHVYKTFLNLSKTIML